MPDPQLRSAEVFAPARVDLAGGTLDLWPLHCFHPASLTVNAAIATGVRLRVGVGGTPSGTVRFASPGGKVELLTRDHVPRSLVATVTFHFVPAGGVSVEIFDQPPVAAGLGGSSVLAVAIARGCLGATDRRMPARDLVATLRDLEAAVLGAPTGVQDYWPALRGGGLAIHLRPGGEVVERLAVDPAWLSARLVVLSSGIVHHSGMVNWEIYRARVDGDRGIAAALDRISVAARRCREGLLAADEEAVGEAIVDEWLARRALAPAVTMPAVDRIIEAGTGAGALAAKACGAGGGGSILFWVAPGRRASVLATALDAAPADAHVVASDIVRSVPRVRTLRA